jgi:hypothetical protein
MDNRLENLPFYSNLTTSHGNHCSSSIATYNNMSSATSYGMEVKVRLPKVVGDPEPRHAPL